MSKFNTEWGFLRHLRDLDHLMPACRPALGHAGQGQAAIGIGREDAQLEPVGTVHRMDQARLRGHTDRAKVPPAMRREQ